MRNFSYRDFLRRANDEWSQREAEQAEQDEPDPYDGLALSPFDEDPEEVETEDPAEATINFRLAKRDLLHFGKFEVDRLCEILERIEAEEAVALKAITLPNEVILEDRNASRLVTQRLGLRMEARRNFEAKLRAKIEAHLSRAQLAEDAARRFAPDVMPASTSRFGKAILPTESDQRLRS